MHIPPPLCGSCLASKHNALLGPLAACCQTALVQTRAHTVIHKAVVWSVFAAFLGGRAVDIAGSLSLSGAVGVITVRDLLYEFGYCRGLWLVVGGQCS